MRASLRTAVTQIGSSKMIFSEDTRRITDLNLCQYVEFRRFATNKHASREIYRNAILAMASGSVFIETREIEKEQFLIRNYKNDKIHLYWTGFEPQESGAGFDLASRAGLTSLASRAGPCWIPGPV